jgi:SAM-dependent methyltransferase
VDARDWDRRWRERADFHARGEPSDAVVEALEALKPGRALDLACGAGRHAVWLAEHGWHVTAVDFSEAALAQARGRGAEANVVVEWVLADLSRYEPPLSSFDLVLAAYLHVSADERREIMRRAAAALALGGTLLVVGHDLENLGTGAPGPSDPALLYTADDIAAELPGLTIERAERVERVVETDAGEARALDALVLASRR